MSRNLLHGFFVGLMVALVVWLFIKLRLGDEHWKPLRQHCVAVCAPYDSAVNYDKQCVCDKTKELRQ